MKKQVSGLGKVPLLLAGSEDRCMNTHQRIDAKADYLAETVDLFNFCSVAI